MLWQDLDYNSYSFFFIVDCVTTQLNQISDTTAWVDCWVSSSFLFFSFHLSRLVVERSQQDVTLLPPKTSFHESCKQECEGWITGWITLEQLIMNHRMKERRNSKEIEIGFRCVLMVIFCCFFFRSRNKNEMEMSQEDGLKKWVRQTKQRRLLKLHRTLDCVFGV